MWLLGVSFYLGWWSYKINTTSYSTVQLVSVLNMFSPNFLYIVCSMSFLFGFLINTKSTDFGKKQTTLIDNQISLFYA